jgi:hypothetical protein
MGVNDGMPFGAGASSPVAREVATKSATQQVLTAKDASRKIGMRLVHPLATAGAKEDPHRYHPRPFLALSIMPLAP